MFTIEEIYEFGSKVRLRFAMKLADLPWDEVAKNREASFYNMKNILVHMVECEDWIVGWVIPGKPTEFKDKNYDEFTSMRMVVDYLKEVESRTRNFLSNASESELAKKVDFVVSSGTFNITVEECLFQSFTEQLYHLGELIALLWQDNINPPPMMWFKNNPRENLARTP